MTSPSLDSAHRLLQSCSMVIKFRRQLSLRLRNTSGNGCKKIFSSRAEQEETADHHQRHALAQKL